MLIPASEITYINTEEFITSATESCSMEGNSMMFGVEVHRPSANDGGILKSKTNRMDTSRQSVTFRDDPYNDKKDSQHSPEELQRIIAARVIERSWLAYRDKKMYKLLKHSTCAAEQSLSYEILRKISPKEANLLRDKGMPVKVRFRYSMQLKFPSSIS